MTETEAPETPPVVIDDINALRLMVRGAYDLQALRIQTGLRLCANFRSKLTDQPVDEDELEVEGEGEKEMSEEAKDIIKQLKESYRRLTEGVARHRTLPDEKKFTGDALISTFSELTLVDQYIRIESQEALQFRQMVATLSKIPIYTDYLVNQVGIGPAMAGVLITYLQPHRARHISSFWKYAGIDVADDGYGRSRRKEHLVEREYINKAGRKAKRMSVTYNPFLKTKLVGVLGGSFLKTNSPWRKAYDGYKHRINSDPNRIKLSVEEWKKIRLAKVKERGGDEDDESLPFAEMAQYWPPGRTHAAANRYMLKMFLADLWDTWRELEGLPVTEPYAVAKLGLPPHGQEAAAE